MFWRVLCWIVRVSGWTRRMVIGNCLGDFNARRRRFQHIVREPYYAFVTCVILTTLMTSWYAVLTYTLAEWRQMVNVQRNQQLTSLLAAFPKQNGLNLTAYQLNVALSNTIALDRDIPDTRPSGCRSLAYHVEDLPTVSVIIPFYNEAWSMLLRCLHSVIDRSPPHLLTELILVDDNSDYHYLMDPLEEYTTVLSSKIRIIRNKEREGLIRARALAARQATGEVIVFLDAHVECNEGWLAPLLHVIKNNTQTIAVPHIDNIIPNTIEYRKWRGFGFGGFQWNMDYAWRMVPSNILKTRKPSDNYITPTIIGCAMAIDRDYFFRLGGFDDDMYIWGGENLEISFRTWMCGGSMEVVPCSRVGHVFRRWLPYSFPSKYGGRYIKFKNYQRVADVWMGDYSLYYYAAIQGEVFYTDADISSLKKRQSIKEKFQCKSFKWYMDNIVRDMSVPDMRAVYHGQFKVLGGNACLSANSDNSKHALPLTYCGMQSPDQTFSYMHDATITHQGRCLTATSQDDVILMSCADGRSEQKWRRGGYDPRNPMFAVYPEANDSFRQYYVVIKNIKLCLTHMNQDRLEYMSIMPCNTELDMGGYQYWSFTLKLDFKFARKMLEKRKNLF